MDMDVIRVPAWAGFAWLRHGFSTRAGGASTVYGGRDLNLGFTKEDDAAAVRENRRRAIRAVAPDVDAFGEMVTIRQVHGVAVKRVATGDQGLRTDEGKATIEADGLMTDAVGVMLGIQVADCVPILLADVRQRVVAALHAGWRGTAAGIVEQGVGGMMRDLGSRPEDVVAAVGPSIGSCCYKVGDEVREAFGRRFGYAPDLFTTGRTLDLWEANRRQLLDAGLRPERVAILGECTACARSGGLRKYFSHRAEQGFTGRAMGMIGMTKCP